MLSSETGRAQHRRRPLRARDAARRDRHRRHGARPAQRARGARGLAPGPVHLRVHLLRAARQRDGRQDAAHRAPGDGQAPGAGGARSRPTSSSPCPTSGMPAAIGYACSLRHPLHRGPHQEPLRHRTFIQPDDQLRAGGHPHEAQPADARSSAASAWWWSTTPSCAATPPASSSTCCSSAGAARGAPAHQLAADPVALLLRHRHGDARRSSSPPT